MKKRYYVKVTNRYYDMKTQKLKDILKIPDTEDIDYVNLIDKRLVISTKEKIYDCRNIG